MDAGEIAAAIEALAAAADAVRALSAEARASAITRVAARLSQPDGELLQALVDSTGLSEPNVAFGLSSTFGRFDRDTLLRILHRRGPAQGPVRVVLAGNVFTAAARPLLLPLLAGTTVIAKASSRDDVLPRAIAAELLEQEPTLGRAARVVTFEGGRGDLEAALLSDACNVQLYGSDATIAALSPRLPVGARLVTHGHGLGACVVGEDADPAQAARAVAVDVSAYDQRGCLSPQAVFVQRDAAAFAERLADALELRGETHPRGDLPIEVGAAQTQWRGVARACGTLHERDRCAVSYEAGGELRPSPGYRNVSVHDFAAPAALRAQLKPLGRQLKAVGIAGGPALHRELGDLAPYVCEAGQMQCPPLDAWLDGLDPMAGFTGVAGG